MKKRYYLGIIGFGALFALGLAGCTKPTPSESDSSTPTIEEYTVTWIVDGTSSTETYKQGEMPVFKYGTEKDADNTYTYTFKGWDKELTTVTQNETLTALFESNVNSYEVTFDVEGVKTSNTYLYGEMPSFDGTPSKEATAQYTYTFKGWDKELASVTANETYTAVFESTLNTYDVTWVVGNNETKETYNYGETPSFKGSTDRESAKYTYTFKGWDKDIDVVTGAATYVAQYDEKINTFVVNFYTEDGKTLLDSKEVEYDAIPTFNGSTPTKESTLTHVYSFNGWLNKDSEIVYDGTLPEVLGTVNYYATFKEAGRLYDLTVNKLNIDGTIIGTEVVQFGYGEAYTLTAPVVDGKVANKDYVKGVMMPETTVILYYSNINTWDKTTVATSFANGSGTEDDPYLITSGAELAYLRDQVDTGNTYEGVYFKMGGSIDLADSNFVIGEGATYTFGGVFDGNNCSIRGLNISGTTTMQALFSNVTATGIIKNLSTYGTVSGGQYTGGVVGRNVGGKIQNCTNYTNVTHANANGAGGVAGGSTGTIINCENYGTISCSSSKNNKTGGVVGAIEGGNVSYCTNYGTVNGYSRIGGIAGEAQQATTLLDHLYNYGAVTGATERIGGIAGQCDTNLSNAINYGTIKGTIAATSNSYTGGIVGVSSKEKTISNCENKGSIECSGLFSGGIVGCVASNTTTTIKDCVNNGTINSTSNGTGGIVGGGVGKTSIYKVISCENYGEVNGAMKVGGIAGNGYSTSSITDSTNYGKVSATNLYLGGVLGCADATSSITISNCTNKGEVSSDKNGVGGIVGGSITTTTGLTISDCANEGKVSGNNKVGGIVGALVVGSDLTNCTNTGEVTAVGANVSDMIGSDERA